MNNLEMDIQIEDIKRLPEDMIRYIGKFYNPKSEMALNRMSRIQNKLREMKNRKPDEWIEKMRLSPQLYDVEIHEIKEKTILYTHHPNSVWKSEYHSVLKSKLVLHKCIEDIKQKGIRYIRYLVYWALPTPQYKGQICINILNKPMIARITSYKGIDGKNYYNKLTYVYEYIMN